MGFMHRFRKQVINIKEDEEDELMFPVTITVVERYESPPPAAVSSSEDEEEAPTSGKTVRFVVEEQQAASGETGYPPSTSTTSKATAAAFQQDQIVQYYDRTMDTMVDAEIVKVHYNNDDDDENDATPYYTVRFWREGLEVAIGGQCVEKQTTQGRLLQAAAKHNKQMASASKKPSINKLLL